MCAEDVIELANRALTPLKIEFRRGTGFWYLCDIGGSNVRHGWRHRNKRYLDDWYEIILYDTCMALDNLSGMKIWIEIPSCGQIAPDIVLPAFDPKTETVEGLAMLMALNGMEV